MLSVFVSCKMLWCHYMCPFLPSVCLELDFVLANCFDETQFFKCYLKVQIKNISTEISVCFQILFIIFSMTKKKQNCQAFTVFITQASFHDRKKNTLK